MATNSTSLTDIFIVLFGTFALSLAVAAMYQHTYKWHKYSQDFTQTIVILAVLIAMVMLIVGSNVAGAFTLMGALSIIRFRNSLKNTRDIGFIFFAIAIGMAMGTKMYAYAVIATPIILGIFYMIDRKNLFAGEQNFTKILKIQIADTPHFQHIFDEILAKYTKFFTLDAVANLPAPMENDENNSVNEKINELIDTKKPKFVKELTFSIIHNENFELEKMWAELEVKNGGKNITIFAV